MFRVLAMELKMTSLILPFTHQTGLTFGRIPSLLALITAYFGFADRADAGLETGARGL